MSRVGVAVRVAPRPVIARHRQLELEPLVVGPQVGVVDRPILADAIPRADLEIGRMKAGAVAGVVDHRAADPLAGIVLAELDRVLASGHARVGPVQLVRARLVGHPVPVGVPERPDVEHDDVPAASGQPLGERGPTRPGADDRQVDLVVVVIAGHPLAGNGAAVDVEQERRVVVGRAEPAPEHRPQPVRPHFPSTPRSRASSTGSRSNAGAPSQLSR